MFSNQKVIAALAAVLLSLVAYRLFAHYSSLSSEDDDLLLSTGPRVVCGAKSKHRLVRWLERVGGFANGLEIVETDRGTVAEGRGVVSLCDLPAGELLLAVPRRVTVGSCAGTNVLLRSPFGGFVDLAEQGLLQPSTVHALFLVWAMFDPSSRRHPLGKAMGPYIDTLPRDVRYPAAWTHAEKVRPNVLPPTLEADELDDNLERIVRVTPGIDRAAYTSDNFKHALGLVFSRAFAFTPGRTGRPAPKTVDAKVGVLVPLLSMLNHENEQAGSHFITGNETHVLLHAGRPVRAGEELLVPYASQYEPLTHFIAKHGFVPPRSEQDWIPVAGWMPGHNLIIDRDVMLPFWIDPLASRLSAENEADNFPWVRVWGDDPRGLLPFARLMAYGTEAARSLSQEERDALAKRCFCAGSPEDTAGKCGLEDPALEARALELQRERIDGLVDFYSRPMPPRPEGVSDAAEKVAVELRERARIIFRDAAAWLGEKGPYEGRRIRLGQHTFAVPEDFDAPMQHEDGNVFPVVTPEQGRDFKKSGEK